jgi:hypothetical protein
MRRFERDPQSELVRRYARILRSAPAEASRFASAPRPTPAPVSPLRRSAATGDPARSKT